MAKSGSVASAPPALTTALSQAAAHCPELRGLSIEADVLALPGRSNLNYRVDAPGGSFALRVPHPDTGPFVDRAQEIAATRIAGDLGIGPELVYAEKSGLMLTRWIDGRALSAEGFRSKPGAVGRVGRTLSRLHRSGTRFAYRFDVLEIIDSYAQTCRERTHEPIPFSPRLTRAVGAARASLAQRAISLVPSHCDLVPENCLDASSRMFLVDWEYAGMNDPGWDLAYLALEAGFDQAQEDALLAAYGDASLGQERLQLFKLLAATLNFLWGFGSLPNEGFLRIDQWLEAELSAAEGLARDDRVDAWIAAIRN